MTGKVQPLAKIDAQFSYLMSLILWVRPLRHVVEITEIRFLLRFLPGQALCLEK